MNKILVTGATGRLGSQVTAQLLKKTAAQNISVLVRDANKATALKDQGITVITGDYSDYASLLNAFKGIDKVYMVSGNDLENRVQQHKDLIKAAVEAGVKQVFYTSFQRKTESGDSPLAVISSSHLITENELINSGLTYTILKHALYADIIPDFAGPQVLETENLVFPGGDGKTAFATTADLAEAAAVILLDNSGRYDNVAVDLSGSQAVTWAEIAAIISSASGVEIQYVSPSIDSYRGNLEKAGLPSFFVDMLAGFAWATEAGEFAEVTGELERIIGREPVSPTAYLNGVYSK